MTLDQVPEKDILEFVREQIDTTNFNNNLQCREVDDKCSCGSVVFIVSDEHAALVNTERGEVSRGGLQTVKCTYCGKYYFQGVAMKLLSTGVD